MCCFLSTRIDANVSYGLMMIIIMARTPFSETENERNGKNTWNAAINRKNGIKYRRIYKSVGVWYTVVWRGRYVRCACCAVIVSAHFMLAAIILNLIFNECTHASAQKKQTGEVILKSYNVWVERSHARLLIIPARICIQRREWWRFPSKLVRCASGPKTRIQTHTPPPRR